MECHKTTTFHWLLHTRVGDLVRWTVDFGGMLKTEFGKKVHIQGFVNEQTIRSFGFFICSLKEIKPLINILPGL